MDTPALNGLSPEHERDAYVRIAELLYRAARLCPPTAALFRNDVLLVYEEASARAARVGQKQVVGR